MSGTMNDALFVEILVRFTRRRPVGAFDDQLGPDSRMSAAGIWLRKGGGDQDLDVELEELR